MKKFLLILVPIVLITLGQTSAKYGALQMADGAPPYNLFILLGYGILIARGVVWVVILRDIKLSLAYPFISLSYVLILAVSHLVFGEPVHGGQLAGTALIIGGVFCVGLGQLRGGEGGDA